MTERLSLLLVAGRAGVHLLEQMVVLNVLLHVLRIHLGPSSEMTRI